MLIKKCRDINLLLVTDSHEKVQVIYGSNTAIVQPKIGPRPPYYTNPRCGWYYPKN
ncbi:hypothetical protein SAMN05880501_102246 [Ureibacillus xyleni]|uniref:Uncharacterized protein n=1 Tax=Ureibacillus xyleni TaxID=614648 RepID=A0A285RYH2_9BACL|nr:hypothetical protein SAMN05880501_102246 [Ureibacillus xyleni]